MKKRLLGNTGIEVSEVGFGAWQLGSSRAWGNISDSEAIDLVHAALDNGCNFFDTAPGYASGKSEELLGKALLGRREQAVINTKFGHQANGQSNFGPEALRTSVEESLKRLQTDYIDTILLHNPPFEFLNGSHPVYEAFEALKAEGKIRAYGASVDSSREMFELIRTTNSQVMEVLFNIFHQETAQAFSAAQEKGVGIIVKVPLDSGWLSGKYNINSRFDDVRRRWSAEIIERRFDLLKQIEFLTEDGSSMVQAALRFILSYPEVSTVIPGVKDIKQLNENLSAAGTTLSAASMQRLRELWERELREQPLPW